MPHETHIKHGLVAHGVFTLPDYTAGLLRVGPNGVTAIDATTFLSTGDASATYRTIADADSMYQAVNGSLTSISGLGGTAGILRKTAADTYTLDTVVYQDTAARGAANGYAPLDASALIPAIHLPAYVDDVQEFATVGDFPGTGATGIIYVALDTNETYRWSGSTYTRIANGAVQAVNGETGIVTLTTNDIAEGGGVMYYTEARFDTRFGTKTTSDLAEGTRLYYTDARVDARFGTYTTDGLTEGTTNLYFTTERVHDVVAGLFASGTGISFTYNDDAGTFTPTVTLAPFSTTDLAEGTNLYFTTGRVLGTALTGLAAGAATPIAATDSLIVALANLQAQVSAASAAANAWTFTDGFTVVGTTVTNNVVTGIAGGQTWNGGTSASEALVINSTSHATKGTVTVNASTLIASNAFTFGTATSTINSVNVPLAGGTTTVVSVPVAGVRAMFVDYVVYSATGQRAGQCTINTNGTAVDFNDVTTNDIGADMGTLDVDAVIAGGNITFRILNAAAGSTAKVIYRYI